MPNTRLTVVFLSALVLISRPATATSITFSVSGPDASAVQPTVDAFRTALGVLNPNVAGSFGSGRREINWDGVPDAFAAPNLLPSNFFNVNSPRGVVFSTPGTGFQVSANPAIGPVDFGNIDPNYSQFFEPFSQERLFTALGSNITDVSFFIPGSTTPAYTTAFGVIFSDVDLPNVTSLEFFDLSNNSLGTFFAAALAGNETFSFLGVRFTTEQVGRVRITTGNQILASGNTQTDLVVMDDFIYGEPVTSVPEPATLCLLGTGLLACARRRFRRLNNRV